jgi:L-threonylcarbamoyladenylate synthase
MGKVSASRVSSASPCVRGKAEPDLIENAVSVLRAGGLVVLPTDTVYGIAALPGDRQRLRRLFRASGRALDGPLPVLIADADALEKVAANPPPAARRLAKAYWPGPLTLVLRQAPSFRFVDDTDLVAVRVPRHELARSLIDAAGGALVVVSAGPPGSPQPTTALDAATLAGKKARLVIDGGPCEAGAQSSMVDCSFERPRLLRPGAIPADRLAKTSLFKFL